MMWDGVCCGMKTIDFDAQQNQKVVRVIYKERSGTKRRPLRV